MLVDKLFDFFAAAQYDYSQKNYGDSGA